MALTANNTIVIEGQFRGIYEEAVMKDGEAVKPGMMIQLDADGLAIKHADAAKGGEVSIAYEDALQGKTVADAYENGDLVRYVIPFPGERVRVVLKAGENVTKADYLTSNGDGTFAAAGASELRVFKCLEALDLSGMGAVDTLIKARRC